VSGWDGGYVTDISYLPGYYRQQSPTHLAAACLLHGVLPPPIAADRPLVYVELGCGHGYGALVLAACNPAWRVVGIDLMPVHIAAARGLAEETGITNACFLEADLATLAESRAGAALPEADVVTLHGVWSWVAEPVRAGIVRLLAAKLKPGGIAHLSYNALPGWQGALGMQRVVREAGGRAGGRSDRQATAGLALVHELAAAEAVHLAGSGVIDTVLAHAGRVSPHYLAHEYMNAGWQPCFHADVAATLAGARLEWVASASLLENFAELMLDAPARAIMDRYDDPVMRELVKDMFLQRVFRHDVFVKGARRFDAAVRDAALDAVRVALLRLPDRFEYTAKVAAGEAELDRDVFEPAVAALGDGPRTLGELLALKRRPGARNPAELLGMLVGTEQAVVVLGDPAPPPPAAVRLNRAAARLFPRAENLNATLGLATGGIGTGVPCQMLDLWVYGRLADGIEPDAAAWSRTLAEGRPEEERAGLEAFMRRTLEERVPVWRRLCALA
jgi:hypothetical protein